MLKIMNNILYKSSYPSAETVKISFYSRLTVESLDA